MATTEAIVEGSTVAEEVAAVPVPAPSPAPETGLKHKLERRWNFWFDNQSKPKQGAAWGTTLRKVYSFDTVEEFWWCVFSLGFFRFFFLLNLRFQSELLCFNFIEFI